MPLAGPYASSNSKLSSKQGAANSDSQRRSRDTNRRALWALWAMALRSAFSVTTQLGWKNREAPPWPMDIGAEPLASWLINTWLTSINKKSIFFVDWHESEKDPHKVHHKLRRRAAQAELAKEKKNPKIRRRDRFHFRIKIGVLSFEFFRNGSVSRSIHGLKGDCGNFFAHQGLSWCTFWGPTLRGHRNFN